MSNIIRDKKKRLRLSIQNQNLARKQLDLAVENYKKEEEQEATKEEDPLKLFSQQLRTKEEEEEKKKYLKPIKEEEDPLNFFDLKEVEEVELDPLKFVKKNEELNETEEPKVLGNLALHDEEKLAEAIKNNDIPEEIIIKKKEKINEDDKKQKMNNRLKTSLRLSSHEGLTKRLNDKLLQRVKNAKKINDGESDKITNETKDSANTLLGTEAQINPANAQDPKQTKQVDLSAFMKK